MPTVEDLRAAIVDNPRLRRLTKEHYQDAVDRWVKFAGEHDVYWTPRNAQLFYNEMVGNQKLKPQSANVILAGLRYAFGRVAALERNPDLNIMSTVIRLNGEDPDQARMLDENEARALCDARRSQTNTIKPRYLRDFAFVVLGLQTGMRRMSFVSCKIENIEGGYLRQVLLKGGRKFDVPLSFVASEALRPYLRWLADKKVTTGALFRSVGPDLKPRKGLTIRGVDNLVQALSKDSRVYDISPHSFRHTFITWARLAGVQPFEIAAITGHASEESLGGGQGVIEKTYTHRSTAGTRAADAVARPWMRP